MILTKENIHKVWFGIVAMLFVVHYTQPHALITPLRYFAPYTLLTLGCVGLLLITRSNILQWQFPQMRYIWMLFGLLFIITPFAETPRASLGMSKLMLMYVPFLLSILIVIDNIPRLKMFVNLLIVSAVFTGIITIMFVDESGADTGNGSFLMNANEFALFAAMVIPYCYYMILFETQYYRKLLYVTAFGIITLSIVASFSRAGVLGAMCAGIVILWFSPKKTSLLFLGVIAVCIGIYVGGDQYIDEISTMTDTRYSTSQYRLEAWGAAWDKFINNPLGNGLMAGRIEIPHLNGPMETHSIWLTCLVETGIFGFWIFAMIWYTNIRDSLTMAHTKVTNIDQKFLKIFGMATLGSLAAYASAGAVTHAFHYPHFWYISALTAAASKVWLNTLQTVE